MILLVLILAVVIPLSLIIWLTSVIFSPYVDLKPLSPWRALLAAVAPTLISSWGLKKGSLDRTGAAAGLVVGFILTISNLCFFSSLLMFFVAASKATKFRSKKKRMLEEDFKEGGQRNWIQVLCNGGVAAEFALIYMIDVGCTEKLVNFSHDYNASWLSMAVLGSLACSCGDTFASEMGTVFGRLSSSRLITTFKKVPKGTNGGVSIVGTVSSLIGGLLVGMAYYLPLVCLTNVSHLENSPVQWPIVPLAGLYGILGSTVDSLLGATLQYSGDILSYATQ
ncbi:hypothetical protein CHS0354_014424 [Potamilus streckersoni]|uniref:Transmembrane protein 19 n=1 Tax=Potamilus streckersoni TaxID=2493646 RepID=A0AAE0VSZ8_9BIVA|nr:hypothetical protein CHS0354_014424 [Potamilus streckersoni]